MKKVVLPLAISLMAATSAIAIAQTTAEQATPPAPAEKIDPPASQAPAAAPTTVEPSSTAAPSTTAAAPSTGTIKLTDEQAKAWVDKPVYSSDNKNLGEVAAVARASSGEVSELHADIGGFLGLGETRVRVMPSEFSLGDDKVVLNITADQAKKLPTIAK